MSTGSNAEYPIAIEAAAHILRNGLTSLYSQMRTWIMAMRRNWPATARLVTKIFFDIDGKEKILPFLLTFHHHCCQSAGSVTKPGFFGVVLIGFE
jgi:hypothetical protein